MLENTGQKKIQTIQKLNTTQKKQTRQNTTKQNYPGSVAFYDTRPGNELDLYYNTPKPARGYRTDIQTHTILPTCTLTPKSHSLMLPWVLTRMFDGFTSTVHSSTSTVWVKKSPLRLSEFYSQMVIRIFNRFFTQLLYVLMYARLQIFMTLTPTLTKLCHIKRDYLVHMICAKCPKCAKKRALRHLRKSLIALLIVVCGKSL